MVILHQDDFILTDNWYEFNQKSALTAIDDVIVVKKLEHA